MVQGKDYYKILGVSKDASDETIKKAYRRLARKYHPDLHPGDKEMERKFKEINEAYGVLGNPDRRKEYDLSGKVSFEGMGPAYSGFDFKDFGFNFGGFEDIFSEVFGARARRKGPVRGKDVEHALHIDFVDACLGTEVEVVTPKSGFLRGGEKVKVKIPPGVRSGTRVRVAGRGEPGVMGGQPGDLYLRIFVNPHPYFRRVDNDIYLDVPITIGEAITGREIRVPTLDGMATVKIPPGTQGGQKLRLKGKGVPTPGGRRGDQYLIIKVAIPKNIDAKSRRLIEEFESINSYDPRRGLW
ncbi:MAG TPA: J domain-containing protein [Deltaproteobacteria bacterium]|nr:J domain-containing protein [Deltaproteobacteria bacterium]